MVLSLLHGVVRRTISDRRVPRCSRDQGCPAQDGKSRKLGCAWHVARRTRLNAVFNRTAAPCVPIATFCSSKQCCSSWQWSVCGKRAKGLEPAGRAAGNCLEGAVVARQGRQGGRRTTERRPMARQGSLAQPIRIARPHLGAKVFRKLRVHANQLMEQQVGTRHGFVTHSHRGLPSRPGLVWTQWPPGTDWS